MGCMREESKGGTSGLGQEKGRVRGVAERDIDGGVLFA